MLETIQQTASVIVVDDTDVSAEVLRRLLLQDGYAVEVAHDGESGLEAVRRSTPDLVLLDVMMPGINGFEVCRRLKSDPATRLTPVVLVTTLDGRDDRIQGMDAGADDFLTKPVDGMELRARVRALLRLKRFTDELDSAEAVILSLARTVEARDPCTEGHCERLAGYAVRMGEAMGLREDELAALYRGGFLHDVGKIAIPDSVLMKPGPLLPDEYELVKRHTIVGDEICTDFRALRPVRPIVRHHHERQDGSGYPDGLAGNQIPLLAQIAGVVDVYDALTTSRPYKEALTPPDALALLRGEAFDGLHRMELVDLLAGLQRDGMLGAAVDTNEMSRRFLKGSAR
ncbi:MAG: response regulator [Acidobacteria bacterium]|jgi:putative two-component system response regulator|nr:response regulator [Acidobacteriota bacterium]